MIRAVPIEVVHDEFARAFQQNFVVPLSWRDGVGRLPDASDALGGDDVRTIAAVEDARRGAAGQNVGVVAAVEG